MNISLDLMLHVARLGSLLVVSFVSPALLGESVQLNSRVLFFTRLKSIELKFYRLPAPSDVLKCQFCTVDDNVFFKNQD